MGGNGEDTCADTARRIRVPEGGQEHPGIYSAGGRPAGPMQVAEGVGPIGLAELESRRFRQCPEGTSDCYSIVLFPFYDNNVC